MVQGPWWRGRAGVGVRLLLAFFGISAFALLAAGAAVYSFSAVGALMDGITEKQVPSALGSLELSRQSERIVSAAPALLTMSTAAEHEIVKGRIDVEVNRLRMLLRDLKTDGAPAGDGSPFLALAPAVERLQANLESLNDVVSGRLVVRAWKRSLLKRLQQTHSEIRKLLAPWLLIVDAEIDDLRGGVNDASLPDGTRAALGSRLDAAYDHYRVLRRAELSASVVNEILLQAGAEEEVDRLGVLVFRLDRLLRELRGLTDQLNPKLRPPVMKLVDAFKDLTGGPQGIPPTQHEETRLVREAKRLLRENAELAEQLTAAVDGMVNGAKRGIHRARTQARSAQVLGTNVLIAVVALAVVSSALIVWLYVGRSIVARLVSLSDSMLAIAAGRLETPIPLGGGDEISRMADALGVFRATAVEVRETNLREIREARRRLTDAIESVSEGFALFDDQDRLVVSNKRYKELYPELTKIIRPGVAFEEIVQAAADRGIVACAAGRSKEWLRERIARHRQPGPAFVQRQTDGRWIQISERRTGDAGRVAVYTDVSELKQQQLALSMAKERVEQTVRELKQAQNSLVEAEKLALLGQLAAGIAHEIKNPLNFVNNFSAVSVEIFVELKEALGEYLETLSRDQRDGIEELFTMLTGNMAKIAEHGGRADRIIQGMLSHSRGGPGEHREVSINALVEESLNLAYHGARATDFEFNVTLERDFDPAAGELEGTPQDLMRVFLNIYSNSFYATRSRRTLTGDAAYVPTVTTSTRDLGEEVEVVVRDNGMGIPPDVKERIFAPFYTTKPAGEGTGLGLSLSYDIVVHGHHGQIDVDSRQGEYTEFVIRLPRRRLPTGMEQPA